jgi:hypothetical protein
MTIREGSKGSRDPYSDNFDRVFGSFRSAGPHLRVRDVPQPGQARYWRCVCIDCDAVWPEGGVYPEACSGYVEYSVSHACGHEAAHRMQTEGLLSPEGAIRAQQRYLARKPCPECCLPEEYKRDRDRTNQPNSEGNERIQRAHVTE